SHELAITMDVFAMTLKAAGIPLPKDRVIDGNDILPLLTSEAKSPHEALFAMGGDQLKTIRAGKWRLHALPPGAARAVKPDEKWVDPRAPDGVTILAPYEQAHPSAYPGVLVGDETKAG